MHPAGPRRRRLALAWVLVSLPLAAIADPAPPARAPASAPPHGETAVLELEEAVDLGAGALAVPFEPGIAASPQSAAAPARPLATTPAPEPGTAALVGLGLLGLVWCGRRR